MFTISGTGGTGSIQFIGRDFSVVIAGNPAGSTVRLEFSEDLSTWYPHYQAGTVTEFTARDFKIMRNRTNYHWRLNCTVYGGTPFDADLEG